MADERPKLIHRIYLCGMRRKTGKDGRAYMEGFNGRVMYRVYPNPYYASDVAAGVKYPYRYKMYLYQAVEQMGEPQWHNALLAELRRRKAIGEPALELERLARRELPPDDPSESK